MKRMLKKLAALALSGAMVLSLCVTALATDPEPTILVDDPNVSSGTPASIASGSDSGTVTNSGPLPDDVIRVKMPLSASGVFDIYLDPHNLIRESGNALGIGQANDASGFADDTLVYFKNTGDSATTFSKTSDDIKIYNKSSVPVTVEMDATWSKGTYVNSAGSGTPPTYSLAMNDADLAEAKADGKAAIYLTMKDSRGNEDAVVEAAKGTPSITVETVQTGTGATNDEIEAATEKVLALVKNVTFEWGEYADAQDRQNLNVGEAGKTPADWEFTFTEATKRTPAVKFAPAKLPNYTTVNGSTRTTNNAYTVVDSTAVQIDETLKLDGSKTYALANGATSADGVIKIQKKLVPSNQIVDVAIITIEWDYEALGALANPTVPATNNNPTYVTKMKAGTGTTEIKLKLQGVAGTGGAHLETAVNRTEGAYSLDQDTTNTTQYAWVLDESKFSTDDSFQNVSFNLTAAISDTEKCIEDWDTAYPTGVTGASLNVTWKVRSCKDVDPSVELTTGIDASNSTAALKVDWGYGDKLVDQISAASCNNVALNVDTAVAISDEDHTVVTLTLDRNGLNAFNSGDGTVTFTFKNSSTGYTKDVTFSAKAAETT